MGGRLTQTDHKVRMVPMSAAVTAVVGTGEALEPRLYLDPARARGRAGADLRTDLAADRPRLGAAAARQLHDRVRRLPAGARGARRPAPAARLPQRLPPPRLVPAERLGPVQGRDPLPLPRLDVQVRRHADRRARGPPVRRAPGQVRARADAGAGRGAVRAGVRQPRSATRRRWPSSSATCPRGWSAIGSRTLEPFGLVRRHASPRTGRWWPRTTSRATTSRSPIPA